MAVLNRDKWVGHQGHVGAEATRAIALQGDQGGDMRIVGENARRLPVIERRQHPRVPVCYLSRFSAGQRTAAEAVVLDLSLGGCRVHSPALVQPGTELDLRISLPKHASPFVVDRAVVRWTRGRAFGVAFVSLRPPEQERLHELVRELGSSPTQSRRA